MWVLFPVVTIVPLSVVSISLVCAWFSLCFYFWISHNLIIYIKNLSNAGNICYYLGNGGNDILNNGERWELRKVENHCSRGFEYAIACTLRCNTSVLCTFVTCVPIWQAWGLLLGPWVTLQPNSTLWSCRACGGLSIRWHGSPPI